MKYRTLIQKAIKEEKKVANEVIEISEKILMKGFYDEKQDYKCLLTLSSPHYPTQNLRIHKV